MDPSGETPATLPGHTKRLAEAARAVGAVAPTMSVVQVWWLSGG